MSTVTFRKKLISLEKHKQRIISELLSIKIMLQGSLVHIHTKCGKDNCWCKDSKGHPHTRVTWHEKERTITRKAPKQHLDWIKGMINNYHRFRSLRKKLISLEIKTKKILDCLEIELIHKARRSEVFSPANRQDRNKTSISVPKRSK